MKQTSQLFLQFRNLPQQAVCDRRNSLPDKLMFLPLPCPSAELPLRVALWKEHLCDLHCTQPRAGWIPGHTESAFGGLGFSVLGCRSARPSCIAAVCRYLAVTDGEKAASWLSRLLTASIFLRCFLPEEPHSRVKSQRSGKLSCPLSEQVGSPDQV